MTLAAGIQQSPAVGRAISELVHVAPPRTPALLEVIVLVAADIARRVQDAAAA